MVRHVVIWSMASGHESELGGLLSDLAHLPEEIEEIVSLSAGPLLNEAELDAVLCVDLDSREDLERYRSHPAHLPVAERLRAAAGEIVVADYEL